MKSFNDFIQKYNLNKATSNINTQHILFPLALNDLKIYLRYGPFTTDVGTVNLHPTKGTHWVECNNQKYLDSYDFSPPQKLSRFILK